MNIVKLNELKRIDHATECGSFGSVYKVLYKEMLYAYKSYHNDIYDTFFNKNMIEKMYVLSKIKLCSSVLPNNLVIDENNNPVTYLTRWINSNPLDTLIDDIEIDKKIQILKNIKRNILLLHKQRIIHGDIHCGNILVSPNCDKTFLIDFDNCQYLNYELNFDYANITAKRFIKNYGVCKELDIYMFNRLTYEILNKLSYTEINEHIKEKNNFIFYENDDYYRICDTMLLCSKEPSDKFLIDNIQKSIRR